MTSIACPVCAAPARVGTRFCARCGAALPQRVCTRCGRGNPRHALFCAACGTLLGAPMLVRTCRHCRHANAAHAVICAACGTALEADAASLAWQAAASLNGTQAPPDAKGEAPEASETLATSETGEAPDDSSAESERRASRLFAVIEKLAVIAWVVLGVIAVASFPALAWLPDHLLHLVPMALVGGFALATGIALISVLGSLLSGD
ncbi:MAG: zinc ribbon domain-containing protein [Chloroflexi bacterium]|nr:zinc ribbon domain-containing protein [Chloroflexota bacterium]